MTEPVLERRRTALDVVLGVLLVLAGLLVLSNVVLATAISVRVLGWTTLGAGVSLLARVLLSLRSGVPRTTALGGIVLTVVGLFMLRDPVVGAVSLTLLVGALLLVTGLTRLVPSAPRSEGRDSEVHGAEGRGMQVLSGLVSFALGLWVLLNVTTATLTLLGVLVGVQIILEGATLAAAGRLRPPAQPAPSASGNSSATRP